MRIPAKPAPITRSVARMLVPALLLGLAACGDDREGGGNGGQQGADVPELPAPEGAVGSVTGMPAHPGPGTTPITGAAMDPGTDATDALAIDSTFPAATPVPAEPGEPGEPVDGVFVLTGTAPQPPAPQSAVEPPAEVAPLPDIEPPPAPVGMERATESTTIIVEPAEDDD